MYNKYTFSGLCTHLLTFLVLCLFLYKVNLIKSSFFVRDKDFEARTKIFGWSLYMYKEKFFGKFYKKKSHKKEKIGDGNGEGNVVQ